MRRIRTAIIGVAALCAIAVLPAAASAACDLPTDRGFSDDYMTGDTTQSFQGHFDKQLNGKFVQLPFEVENGVTGMRIRYCFAKSNAADDNPTLDLGVYGAKPAGTNTWSQDQRRGWSGSSVRIVGIGENGYTDETTYNNARRNYVAGHTSRAFKPGPIEAGTWAVELGAGWIDPDGSGVDWKVEVKTSKDPGWSTGGGFVPDPYTPNVANPNPGWYHGDLHVHGESEPGNAPMSQTLDLGFKPLSEGGNGLDFISLVEHNNDNSRLVLGSQQDAHPDKVVIPGVEVTTYNGHANAHGSDNFADFRFSEVYRWDDSETTGTVDTLDDDELKPVRGSIDPPGEFQKILDGGGFTQVNHPETLKDAPALCRGCAWTYDDERTGWDKVSAIEITNGAGGAPKDDPLAMNPFTTRAIGTYERLLAAGHHIAAVGSSDDHQGGEATGPLDGEVGIGATVVYAEQLSQAAIIAAVRAGHTYAKPFGAAAPDVELKAGVPGKNLGALPGDSVSGPSMNIRVDVARAGNSAYRPGPYTLRLLQDGIEVDAVAVTSDAFNHTFKVKETGRYSFSLTRQAGPYALIEAYSTPVWFTHKASNAFSFKRFKANRKKGTAKLRIKVASPGKVTLTGRGLKKVQTRVRKQNQTVTLNLRPKAWLKKKLRKRGQARVKVRVRNKPTGAKALTKSKNVKLVAKKVSKKKKRRR